MSNLSLNTNEESDFEPLNQKPIQSSIVSPQKSNNTRENSLCQILIVLLLVMVLITATKKTWALMNKQQQILEISNLYEKAIKNLQVQYQKLFENVREKKTFSNEEYQKLQGLKNKLKQMEKIFNIQKKSQKAKTDEHPQQRRQMKKIEQISQILEDNYYFLDFLINNAKQIVRQDIKVMFDNILKKNEFKDQKKRNPLMLERMNLKSPFMDSIQKRILEQEMQKQTIRLQNKYKINLLATEIPLCIIVSTRNNGVNFRFEANLQSILNQDYNNYKVIIIDDASNDQTGVLIKYFLKKNKVPGDKFLVFQNQQRITAIPNIYRAIKNYCKNDQVAVLISGDDQLLGRNVFKLINSVYQTKHPGIAYTNHFSGYLQNKNFSSGYSSAYSLLQQKNRNYRLVDKKFGHMTTFRVQIFLQIKQQHLKNRDGTWIEAAYDQTFILPILEMSCDSIQYIDENVYLYNYGTGQNDGEIRKDIQSAATLYVRQLPRYECIEKYKNFAV